ncbi:GNAT family N-acetyltransferase [Ovoidimarina sediminis]|uniref:GNAT family N-acetyltransferase n=1 Tax=Ovoidimarina sediminis TaxID=3079856 RepID=UPI00290E3434|nr:GNAT family N-acetyltransferase [Rhodophyticola sp. MJ-SS7]MDU8942160.1 GNAT family N-acetyltransferase [Rhodophyticola sp. MJ-SS7]
MTLTISAASAAELPALLPVLARLRIRVFRDWPYLYDGDLDYEERYLSTFAKSAGAIVVLARDGNEIVGAATGVPLGEHDPAFASPLVAAGYDPGDIFYCAESVLLPDYRGLGAGHAFFDQREAAARAQGCKYSSFCAVIRSPDHPARPPEYRPLDSFWKKRGYTPIANTIVHYTWRDLGGSSETEKPMQVWIKSLVAEIG